MADVTGERPVQHSEQLGELGQGRTQLPILWQDLSLESCPGQAHRKTAQG